MIGYRFLPLAEEEMTEASLFYETARSGFGDIFLDDVQRALDTVRERPEIGANIAYGFRRVLLQRFPFSIIYWTEGTEVVVAAVAHQRRRPNYWIKRI